MTPEERAEKIITKIDDAADEFRPFVAKADWWKPFEDKEDPDALSGYQIEIAIYYGGIRIDRISESIPDIESMVGDIEPSKLLNIIVSNETLKEITMNETMLKLIRLLQEKK